MNRLIFIGLLMIWGTVLPALPSTAQNRYENKAAEDFWHQSRNINGIREIPVYSQRRILSFAELRAGAETGGFHDPSEADRSFGAGARAGALLHLPKTSLLGTFSFRETFGKETRGSLFQETGRYPFDILTFDPGDKTARTLTLSGGITTTLSRTWSLGGKMNLEAADASRQTDDHPKGCRLDLSVEPSLLYRNDNWRTGISFLLRRQSESVSLEGNPAASDGLFLDRGLFYGGFLPGGTYRFPVTILSYGAAVQASLVECYSGEVAFTRSRGSAGIPGSAGFLFPENRLRILLEYREGGTVSHWIRVRYEGRSLSNNEVEPVSQAALEGSRPIYREREDRIGVSYKAVTPWNAGLDAQISGTLRNRHAFPSRSYTAQAGEGLLEGGLSLWRGFGSWRLTAGIEEQGAFLDTDVLKSLGQEGAEPVRLAGWYDPCHEYRMMTRAGVRILLRRDFGKGLYLEADGSFTEGFRLRYLDGSTRLRGGLAFGMEF